MSTITLDRAAWDRWKAQLAVLADASTVSVHDLRVCLASLNVLEETQCESSAATPPRATADSRAVSASPPPPPRRNIGTQLCTVRPLNFSHHLLSKVKYQNQVKHLSTRVGSLAATLYEVVEAFWKVLLHHHSRASRRHKGVVESLRDAVGSSETDGVERSGATAGVVSVSSPTISSTTQHTFHSLLGRTAIFDAALLSFCASAAAWERGDEESITGPREHQPFLCRRCRQDGRTAYEYDREKMRLVAARPAPVEHAPAPPTAAAVPPHGRHVTVAARSTTTYDRQAHRQPAPKQVGHLPLVRH